jgi:hypothetical protein
MTYNEALIEANVIASLRARVLARMLTYIQVRNAGGYGIRPYGDVGFGCS